MHRLVRYFLLMPSNDQAEVARLAAEGDLVFSGRRNDSTETVSASRIALSYGGLMLGIILSFFVTGVSLERVRQDAVASVAPPALVQVDADGITPGQGTNSAEPNGEPELLGVSGLLLFKILIGSVTISCLTYPHFYSKLNLYRRHPVFLLLMVSFQYGFFWNTLLQASGMLK